MSGKCYEQQQSPDAKTKDYVGKLSYIVGKPNLISCIMGKFPLLFWTFWKFWTFVNLLGLEISRLWQLLLALWVKVNLQSKG